MAAAGAAFVAAFVALLGFLGPLGGWLTLPWMAAASVLMLAARVGFSGGLRTRTVRSS